MESMWQDLRCVQEPGSDDGSQQELIADETEQLQQREPMPNCQQKLQQQQQTGDSPVEHRQLPKTAKDGGRSSLRSSKRASPCKAKPLLNGENLVRRIRGWINVQSTGKLSLPKMISCTAEFINGNLEQASKWTTNLMRRLKVTSFANGKCKQSTTSLVRASPVEEIAQALTNRRRHNKRKLVALRPIEHRRAPVA